MGSKKKGKDKSKDPKVTPAEPNADDSNRSFEHEAALEAERLIRKQCEAELAELKEKHTQQQRDTIKIQCQLDQANRERERLSSKSKELEKAQEEIKRLKASRAAQHGLPGSGDGLSDLLEQLRDQLETAVKSATDERKTLLERLDRLEQGFRTDLCGVYTSTLRGWIPDLDRFKRTGRFSGAEITDKNFRTCITTQPVLMLFRTRQSLFGWYSATGYDPTREVKDPSRTSFLFAMAGVGMDGPVKYPMRVEQPLCQLAADIVCWHAFGIRPDRKLTAAPPLLYHCDSVTQFGKEPEVTEAEVFARL